MLPQTNNDLLPLLRTCSAIITESGSVNSHSAIVGLTLEKPVIVGAEHATKILKSGTAVTVDGRTRHRFSGIEKKKKNL